MIGTLEVTVKVYLNSDIEATDSNGESTPEIREIVDAVVSGDTHENIAETELVEFNPGPESKDADAQ